ncbi:hypothetical protein CNMCM8689_008549 [Aspergillus fumigatus]|nr:hypothetical protein CNMCM8689_008549 [Aspergillus fumigatus]KAH2155760.1 hypothetical protein KXW33_007773 [Aspergillus fumigatus]KAJ8152604.1 hypothetical protein LV155_006734 [Aspergillus fumigatus]KAJ8155317.1 hypothetical protein LV162_006478 [Aspergillus fumigatus]KAJ8174994.1 hypothetical protein LV163_007533 [Aspergillus fumigatus]
MSQLVRFATLFTLTEDHCGGSGNSDGLLYYLNLNTSFDTAISNLTALFGNISKAGGIANNIAPTYRDGAMFTNDNELYLYGYFDSLFTNSRLTICSGLLRLTDSQDPPAGNTVLGYERYQYGPDRESWQPGFIIDNLDTGVTRYVTNGAGVSAPNENLGFYFSGMRGKDWGPIYADDKSANVTSDCMIKVDMSSMRDNKWSNLSLPAHVPARANGELVWVPVAESGVLVAIGGVINPATIFSSDGLTSAQQNASKRVSPGLMETVSVYDVSGDKWYLQNTTGDIPPQLTQFCSIHASAQDGSSHNIYIYGGYDGLSMENTPSDDVYVLSLPSFSWIKLYSGNTTHGRSGHRCVKPYPDQMLVLGGVHLDPTHCLDGGVIQVFNLNTGRFQNTYNPNVWNEYKVPDLITTVIGGDSEGGATKASPISWTNASLADVFKTKYTNTISTWYPYNSTSSISPTIAPAPDKGSSFPKWASAIIGVILGFLFISAAAIFWFLRRRHKLRESQSTGDRSTRSWILRWLHTSGSATGVPKSGDTTAPTGYSVFTNESTITPATAVSPQSVEAGSDPVYEMLGHATTLPVELPTPYNNNSLPSPVSPPGVSGTDYVSPITVSTPSTEDEASPVRPPHYRHMSSLSSVPTIANVMRKERRHRQTYRSDTSEGSVELETTLNDIISHSSDQPYTFEAFVDFLARNHCLETLEFISEVKHYRESYNLSLARFSVSGKDPKEREDSYLFREWQHIKDAYIAPNAPREINIPGWMRDALMEIAPEVSYPPPILLEPVLHYAYEMLAEDAVLPFIRSLADIADTNGAGHLQHRRQAYEPPRIIRPVDETVTLSSYVAC